MATGGKGNPNALLRVLQGGQSLVSRIDAWQNLATGLGSLVRDKATQLKFRRTVVLEDEVLDAMYNDDDLSALIVDIFPDEALREIPSIKIGTDEDGEQDADDLAEQEAATNQAMIDWEAWDKVGDAARWGRLFGVGAIFVGADDGQDVSEPLNEANISTIRFLSVLDKQDFSAVKFFDDPLERGFGEPELYQLHRVTGSRAVAQQDIGVKVHASRIITFPGVRTTKRKRIENNGEDLSVLQRVHDVMMQFVQSWQSVAHVMTDGNQAVFKIKGLMEMIASGNKQALIDRMEITDISRSVTRAVMLDADSESFERDMPNLTGVPEVLDRMMMRLSSASRVPVTILMGRSPAGMNATGDGDFKAFFGAVKTYQTRVLASRIRRLVKLLFLSADGPTGGAEPENWSIEFPILFQPDLGDQVEARAKMAVADAAYMDRGALSPEEVRASRFTADGFSIETQTTEEEDDDEGGSGHLPEDREDANRFDRIEKRGDEYVLISAAGDVLGTHSSREAAERQERTIKAAEQAR